MPAASCEEQSKGQNSYKQGRRAACHSGRPWRLAQQMLKVLQGQAAQQWGTMLQLFMCSAQCMQGVTEAWPIGGTGLVAAGAAAGAGGAPQSRCQPGVLPGVLGALGDQGDVAGDPAPGLRGAERPQAGAAR